MKKKITIRLDGEEKVVETRARTARGFRAAIRRSVPPHLLCIARVIGLEYEGVSLAFSHVVAEPNYYDIRDEMLSSDAGRFVG